MSGIKKPNKVFIIVLAMYSSYLTSCDIESVYYRVSDKSSPHLLIFDFSSTHDSCPAFSW